MELCIRTLTGLNVFRSTKHLNTYTLVCVLLETWSCDGNFIGRSLQARTQGFRKRPRTQSEPQHLNGPATKRHTLKKGSHATKRVPSCH